IDGALAPRREAAALLRVHLLRLARDHEALLVDVAEDDERTDAETEHAGERGDDRDQLAAPRALRRIAVLVVEVVIVERRWRWWTLPLLHQLRTDRGAQRVVLGDRRQRRHRIIA